jgi:hypothetical protein
VDLNLGCAIEDTMDAVGDYYRAYQTAKKIGLDDIDDADDKDTIVRCNELWETWRKRQSYITDIYRGLYFMYPQNRHLGRN